MLARVVMRVVDVVAGAAVLAALVPFIACAAAARAWRWLELRAVYRGDAERQDRDRWKGS